VSPSDFLLAVHSNCVTPWSQITIFSIPRVLCLPSSTSNPSGIWLRSLLWEKTKSVDWLKTYTTDVRTYCAMHVCIDSKKSLIVKQGIKNWTNLCTHNTQFTKSNLISQTSMKRNGQRTTEIYRHTQTHIHTHIHGHRRPFHGQLNGTGGALGLVVCLFIDSCWLRLPRERWRSIVMSASVCLSFCPRAYPQNHMLDIYHIFCACCLWPWFNCTPQANSDIYNCSLLYALWDVTSASDGDIKLILILLSAHDNRQGVDISFTVCLFVCTVTDFSGDDKASVV